MKENILKGVELQFDDLSQKAQEKLYLSDKKKFEEVAAKSQYYEVRRLVVNNEESSSKSLDEIFKIEIQSFSHRDIISLLWQHPNFEKNDEKFNIIMKSSKGDLIFVLAEDEKISSELLNQIILDTIKRSGDDDIIHTAIKNPNFKMGNETRIKLAESQHWEYRQIAAKEERCSEAFLNQMLVAEIQGEEDEDVIKAITKNCNFVLDDPTREVILKEDKYHYILIGDKKCPSKFLNRVLRREIIDGVDMTVIDSILLHPNFKMDDKTRNHMLRTDDIDLRAIVAQDIELSQEFLEEMYRVETNEYVQENIENNLLRTIVKEKKELNIIQQKQILAVLRKVKRSRKRVPLTKYLEEILQIIS